MIKRRNRPLEGWPYPHFFDARYGDRWNTGGGTWSDHTIAKFNPKAIIFSDNTLNGQTDREVVSTITVDVDVVVEQDQIRSNQEFTCEGPFLPSFEGGAVVPG